MAKTSGKKVKTLVCRFINKDTGEHYTIKLSKKAYEKMSKSELIKKYSRKLRKHVPFVLTKNVT